MTNRREKIAQAVRRMDGAEARVATAEAALASARAEFEEAKAELARLVPDDPTTKGRRARAHGPTGTRRRSVAAKMWRRVVELGTATASQLQIEFGASADSIHTAGARLVREGKLARQGRGVYVARPDAPTPPPDVSLMRSGAERIREALPDDLHRRAWERIVVAGPSGIYASVLATELAVEPKAVGGVIATIKKAAERVGVVALAAPERRRGPSGVRESLVRTLLGSRSEEAADKNK